ncbi:MAG: carboxypeptidase-like regulatory domain-containing protein [Acidobacteriota bacterium]
MSFFDLRFQSPTPKSRGRGGDGARRALPFVAAAAIGALVPAATAAPAAAQGNDRCQDGTPVETEEFIFGDFTDATSDGASSCDGGPGTRDRWYRWVAPTSDRSFLLFSERPDIDVSIHAACPGTVETELACGVNGRDITGLSFLGFGATAGESYYLRVAEATPGAGVLPYSGYLFQTGGVITGVVTDAAGQALEGISVGLGAGIPDATTLTDAEGRYRFGGLEYGFRQLYAGRDSTYVAELYDDIPCPDIMCLEGGDLISAGLGATVTANFALEPGASISGVLTDEDTGATLSNRRVALELLSDEIVVRLDTITDGQGRYTFDGLVAGDYAVFAVAIGYVPEYWDDVECTSGDCDVSQATPISLAVGESVDGIDFALDPGASIRGQVRDAETGEPVAFEAVELRNGAGESLRIAIADGAGRYAFNQMAAGTYFVSTASRTYINEVWPSAPCTFGRDCPTAGATAIQVDEDQFVGGIDFALDLGGVVRATVANRFTGEPVVDSRIRLFDAAGNFLVLAVEGLNGEVVITGLPAGEFRAVAFTPTGRFIAQVYVARDCPGPDPDGCENIPSGSAIEVTPGETTGIGFSLRPDGGSCVSDSTTLCLNDNRFAVRARWQTFEGTSFSPGVAERLPGIDDSGAFWFFDAANIELVVKVLDACGEPFDRFWVFASGLTNVGVELSVTDTLIGEEKTYSNPLGTAFQPIQDTDAFATCFVAGPTGSLTAAAADGPAPDAAAEIAALEAHLAAERRRAADASPGPAVDAEPAAKADCTPGAATLCLGENGRFRVNAAWETPDGDAGPATAVPFREDTGFFWFFDPSNVEVIVKVLDACADPFDRFWVFAGGLTNVDVQLQVTDTATGEARVYRNPQGQRFQPIQDTDAFNTCP